LDNEYLFCLNLPDKIKVGMFTQATQEGANDNKMYLEKCQTVG